MSSPAKTNTLVTPGHVETESILRPGTFYYLPVNNKPKIREERKSAAATKQEIPIDKWIMPVQPQGYLAAKQHDIF